MPVHKRMKDILPKKAVCDRLVAAYVDMSETLYRILHLPTFSEQYNLYWEGKLQADYFLPQLLAVCSIASRFETKSKGMGHERIEGVHIPTACALVRTWLDGLQGRQLVDISTLQVELLLMHARRMITPRLHDSWTKLGSVVRLAMTMGLHRDPSEFRSRIPVFLGELRRRLWFTILDMDLHHSLACSLPCTIREGDFSCRPPRNLDDNELYHGMQELPPTKPIDQHTDNQMQVYAAMTLGIRMRVTQVISHADSIRDYQEVIEIGSRLERYLEDINYVFPRQGIMNDTQKSKLWRSRVILDMHVRRPLLALYRPFAMGAPDAPPQISRAYLKSSTVILKYLDEIDPMIRHFQDIVDMYHQVLKQDIIQAAFSVCYYIRSINRPQSEGVSQQALRMSPDSNDDYPAYIPDNLLLWSPERLVSTVEKTLDLLLNNVGGRDVKALVTLVVVLESSKVTNPKEEDLTRALGYALDRCMRASNLTMDKLTAVHPGQPVIDSFQDPHAHRSSSFLFSESNVQTTGITSAIDFDTWVMWSGWE